MPRPPGYGGHHLWWGSRWRWRGILHRIHLTALLVMLVGSAGAGEPVQVITVPNQGFEEGYWHEYFLDLLSLALEQTVADHGAYEIQRSVLVMEQQERALRSVCQGRLVDVAWAMTTRRREQDLLPIRIPLTRGLLGYRLLVVRKIDLPRFSMVTDRASLQSLSAGQGLGWPDTDILRANHLPVMAGRDFSGLYQMLRRGRFDYFPRGVMEAWGELDGGLGGEDLTIEPRLLIQYPTAVYFFVHRSATDLARRIEDGLRLAIQDGSFDVLFKEAHQEAIVQGDLSSRRMIRLANPTLPRETPMDDPSLWLDGAQADTHATHP